MPVIVLLGFDAVFVKKLATWPLTAATLGIASRFCIVMPLMLSPRGSLLLTPLPWMSPPTTLDAENADSGDVDLDSPPVENAEEDSSGSEDDSLEAEVDKPLASALSSEPAPDLLTSQGLIKDAPDVQVPGVQKFPVSSLTDTSVKSDESEPESIATSELMDSDAVPDNMSPVSERPSRRRKRSRHGSSRRAALGKSSRLSVVSEDAPTYFRLLKVRYD